MLSTVPSFERYSGLCCLTRVVTPGIKRGYIESSDICFLEKPSGTLRLLLLVIAGNFPAAEERSALNPPRPASYQKERFIDVEGSAHDPDVATPYSNGPEPWHLRNHSFDHWRARCLCIAIFTSVAH
jgi:hypothetical protein